MPGTRPFAAELFLTASCERSAYVAYEIRIGDVLTMSSVKRIQANFAIAERVWIINFHRTTLPAIAHEQKWVQVNQSLAIN